MEPENLSRELIILSPEETIQFISDNRSAIRTMFLAAWDSKEHKLFFETILKTIYGKKFTVQQEQEIEVQSLFVHLAYYFKRVNIPAYLTTCHSKIVNPYFKLRLDAWMKYKKYHDFAEHIKQFKAYVELLTLAQEEAEDGNFNELLGDLKEYVDYAANKLSEPYLTELRELLANPRLISEFSLLKQFQENNASKVPDLGVVGYNGNEYEPTDFANLVFDNNFLSEIKKRSVGYPKVLLGYPSGTIYNIIGKGQADFDEDYKELKASDVVNIYCYFNMRMHFFSSLSFYERSKLYEKYYNTSAKIKFIDIGCGPATSGLAFTDYLHSSTEDRVYFDYYGIDIAENMRNKADEMLTNDVFANTNDKACFNDLSEVAFERLKDANCIIINCCYVFASTSLPYQKIAAYLNEMSKTYPFVPKYLMYQNTTEQSMNQTYSKFKGLLNGYKIEWTGNEKIKYHNQQNDYWDAKVRDVYYEILLIS